MNFLNYMKDPELKESPDNYVIVEYRLLCSGELYNGKVLTADWRKSDATRLLLTSPFELTVVSQPFDDYPQELSLRFKVSQVTEKKDNVSFSFLPDEDIARDIASFLSLFCRRLIIVSAKVRESRPNDPNEYPAVFRDWPIAFTNCLKLTSWKRQPSTVVYGAKGVERITDYNPPPKPIDPDYIKKIFLSLPHINHVESIVLSARRYALALELIQNQPDFSYQSLISSAETIATSVLRSYKPSETEMVDVKRPVFDLALKFGLSEGQAKEVAVAACQEHSWNHRKFKKFLCDHVGEELWTKDDVFMDMALLIPQKERFESALSQIYVSRSKGLHAGHHYPITAAVGTSPWLPAKIILELGSLKSPFPPVTWFERVVNIALRTFVERSAELSSESGQPSEIENET